MLLYVDDDGRNHGLFNPEVDAYERVYSIVIWATTDLNLFLFFTFKPFLIYLKILL